MGEGYNPKRSKYALPDRWSRLQYHPVQAALWRSPFRFNCVPAGRRGGKTELAKRRGIIKALRAPIDDYWVVFAAPTHRQAKRIFWRDLKRLTPEWLTQGKSSESELTIRLKNGAEITVTGMDAPDRIEGRPIDFIVCDEYGNMHESVWSENLRPGLFTRGRPPGEAWMIGVPEGRNHYYRMAKRALRKDVIEWGHFTWPSADILPPEEIAAAKEELDELTFQQEYEAAFINFTGRAYYPFDAATHASDTYEHDPHAQLNLCFDFNVSPGVAVVCQERRVNARGMQTVAIGEVHIPRNSNTVRVCDKLAADYGHHEGEVVCYGDATGGAKGSAKVKGSDWELIETTLRPIFGDRLSFDVPKANPRERVRVNAVNSRLKSAKGTVNLYVDARCRHLIDDFEGVTLIEGGTGEIDKKADKKITHLTDALGYYVERVHSVAREVVRVESL